MTATRTRPLTATEAFYWNRDHRDPTNDPTKDSDYTAPCAMCGDDARADEVTVEGGEVVSTFYARAGDLWTDEKNGHYLGKPGTEDDPLCAECCRELGV